MKVKSFNGLPPNFDVLPRSLQLVVEEGLYRRRLKASWGFCPGDPRLTSMSADGLPLSGQFGKAVKCATVEGDDPVDDYGARLKRQDDEDE